MNTQYFRYAIEVEKTGSITQAANNLFMSQPTLSKAIKDLEDGLGFAVFKRTSRGVVPTQKGTEFLSHARKISSQLQKMEHALRIQENSNQLFSLAIPRVSYIAQAAADYIRSFDDRLDLEIDIQETGSLRVVDAVAYGHFVLGILHCRAEDEEFYLKELEKKSLQYELVWQSDYMVLMHEDHPLAKKEILSAEELAPYIEVTFGDEELPNARGGEVKNAAGNWKNRKRILVYDRAMQFDLLRTNPMSYTWSSPVPKKILQTHHLVQRRCSPGCRFKDLLISRGGYRFSKLDRAFIDRLCLQRNEVAYGD